MDSIDVGSLKELPMEKLSEIAKAAAKALQDKKHEELLSAWDNFANKANAIGMTVDDALNKCYKTGYKGLRTVPIKYRDPLNHNNVWSGRGRTPNWITEYEKEGKNANDFLVDKE